MIQKPYKLYFNPLSALNKLTNLSIDSPSNYADFFDSLNMSLFTHYIEAMNEFRRANDSTNYKLLIDKLSPILLKFREFLTIPDKNGDTIFHTLSKLRNYELILHILEKFPIENLVEVKCLEIKNKSDEYFYENMFDKINNPTVVSILKLLENSGVLKRSINTENKFYDSRLKDLNREISLNLKAKNFNEINRKLNELNEIEFNQLVFRDNNCFNLFNLFVNSCNKMEYLKNFVSMLKVKLSKKELIQNLLSKENNLILFLINKGQILEQFELILIDFLSDLLNDATNKNYEKYYQDCHKNNLFHILAIRKFYKDQSTTKLQIFKILIKFLDKINKDLITRFMNKSNISGCLPLIYFIQDFDDENLFQEVLSLTDLEAIRNSEEDDLDFRNLRVNVKYTKTGLIQSLNKLFEIKVHPSEALVKVDAKNFSQVLKILNQHQLLNLFITYKYTSSIRGTIILDHLIDKKLDTDSLELILNYLVERLDQVKLNHAFTIINFLATHNLTTVNTNHYILVENCFNKILTINRTHLDESYKRYNLPAYVDLFDSNVADTFLNQLADEYPNMKKILKSGNYKGYSLILQLSKNPRTFTRNIYYIANCNVVIKLMNICTRYDEFEVIATEAFKASRKRKFD